MAKNSEGIVNHQKQRSYDIYNRAYLYNHDAFAMMIETFSGLQKENESEDSLYEKFEQAEKRYAELQLEYNKVKTKYNAWREEIDKS